MKKSFETINSDTVKYFCGHVRASFADFSPIYSSGLIIDSHHVLATLSGVFSTVARIPLSIKFFVYGSEEDRYRDFLEVNSIIVHGDSFKGRESEYEYAFLRFENPLPFLSNLGSIPVFNDLLSASFKYHLYGFRGDRMRINHFENLAFKINEKDEFLYEDDLPIGTSGSPLFIENDGKFSAVGIHVGKNEALKLTGILSHFQKLKNLEEKGSRKKSESMTKSLLNTTS